MNIAIVFNKPIWLAYTCCMTCNIQSLCCISEYRSYSTIKFLYEIDFAAMGRTEHRNCFIISQSDRLTNVTWLATSNHNALFHSWVVTLPSNSYMRLALQQWAELDIAIVFLISQSDWLTHVTWLATSNQNALFQSWVVLYSKILLWDWLCHKGVELNITIVLVSQSDWLTHVYFRPFLITIQL